MSLIVADGLTKTYITGTVRVEALRDLTLTIDRASFVSFVGPSGSGKTTPAMQAAPSVIMESDAPGAPTFLRVCAQ